MKDFLDLLARVLISFIFFYEAYDSIAFFQSTKETMTFYNLTWNQDLLLYGAIFLLVVGAILVLLGYRSSMGALMLLIYWVPVTFIVHSWWNDPIDIRRMELMMFMKNIAIMGGLLMIMANGSGRYSMRRLFATTRVPG